MIEKYMHNLIKTIFHSIPLYYLRHLLVLWSFDAMMH